MFGGGGTGGGGGGFSFGTPTTNTAPPAQPAGAGTSKLLTV